MSNTYRPILSTRCFKCLIQFQTNNLSYKMLCCTNKICIKCLEKIIIQTNNQQNTVCGNCHKLIKISSLNELIKQNKNISNPLKILQKKQSYQIIENLQSPQKILPKQISSTLPSQYLSNQVNNNYSIINANQSRISMLSYPNELDTFDGEQLLLDPEYQTNQKQKFNRKQNQNHDIDSDICSIHDKILDIACITDKQRICSHCALFGKHKDHRLKTIKQFETQIISKMTKYNQICQQKEKLIKTNNKNLQQQYKKLLYQKKQILKKQILKKYEYLSLKLQQNIQNLLIEVDKYINNIQQNYTQLKCLSKYKKWQQQCSLNIQALECKYNQSIKNKLKIFYGSALEISSQGSIYLEQIRSQIKQEKKKILLSLQQCKIGCNQMINIKDMKAMYLIKISNYQKHKKINQQNAQQQINVVDSDNSFIQNDMDQNSTTLSRQTNLLNTISVKKKPIKTMTQGNLNFQKKNIKPVNRIIKQHKSPSLRQTSLLTTSILQRNRSNPKKINSNFLKTNNILPRDSNEVLNDFLKNDLTDVLDLSNCNLFDENITTLISDARKIRKIKALKLNKNNLTNWGFQTIIQYLIGTSNLNLSDNQITQNLLDLIVLYQTKFASLRTLNILGNNINQKKCKKQLQQLKKMGVIVTL